MLKIYLKLKVLPVELREANKIKSKMRLDCIAYTDNYPGGYKGYSLLNNKKEQLYMYKSAPHDVINSHYKRIAEWVLIGNSGGQQINFSSIYIEDIDCVNFGYGYPNSNLTLRNGHKNPMYEFCHDGYLFIVNPDYTEIEILIIPNGRNLISSYYQRLIDGDFDDVINDLRNQSKVYFPYIGL